MKLKEKPTSEGAVSLTSLDPTSSFNSNTKKTFFFLKQTIQLVCLHLKNQLKEEKQTFLLRSDSHLIIKSMTKS